jgi:hypothetical protein
MWVGEEGIEKYKTHCKIEVKFRKSRKIYRKTASHCCLNKYFSSGKEAVVSELFLVTHVFYQQKSSHSKISILQNFEHKSFLRH